MDQSAANSIRLQPPRAAMSSATLSGLACRAKLLTGPHGIHEIKHESTRSDMYRQRAADARNRATQTNNPYVKSAL